jgi:hypothetical protein
MYNNFIANNYINSQIASVTNSTSNNGANLGNLNNSDSKNVTKTNPDFNENYVYNANQNNTQPNLNGPQQQPPQNYLTNLNP